MVNYKLLFSYGRSQNQCKTIISYSINLLLPYDIIAASLREIKMHSVGSGTSDPWLPADLHHGFLFL